MRRLLTLLLALSLATGLFAPVCAANFSGVETALSDTAQQMYRAAQSPKIATVGGDWAVLGLARSGADVPRAYFQSYYRAVERYLSEHDGVLHETKYTEYSRVILALTAAGYDPRDVGGYDLTVPLGDFERTVWQGLNGPAFALIALDSAGYDLPQNPAAATQATREGYLAEILSRQLPDGGFALEKGGTKADADVTGMVLQALAGYRHRDDVAGAIDRALGCLSHMGGDFAAWGDESAESLVQVIVALCQLGIAPDDPRFAAEDATLLDQLLACYLPGKGFARTAGGEVNQMATEQALYALAAVSRLNKDQRALFDMRDVGILPPPEGSDEAGLPGRHEDLRPLPVTAPGKTFSDVAGHENQAAIEALAARGIVSGKSETEFDPESAVTRAQFAAMLVRGLGLPQGGAHSFQDVPPDSWFSGYVGAACRYGMVSGTSPTTFHPQGLITREEAATMTARAAELCGMDTALESGAVRDLLAQFGDYRTVSDWARGPLAFCYQEGILSQDALDIHPKEAVTRGETARMLWRMLEGAGLI